MITPIICCFLFLALFPVTAKSVELPAGCADTQVLVQQRQQQFSQLTATEQQLKEKIEKSGLTPAMGLLLQKEQQELPDIKDLRAERQLLRTAIPETQLRLVEREEQIKQTGARQNPDKSQLEELSCYFYALVELDAKDKDLIDNTASFSAFINERIYWIPNTSALSNVRLQSLTNAASYFIEPEQWLPTLKNFRRYLPHIILWPTLMLALLLTYLLVMRKKLNQIWRESSNELQNLYTGDAAVRSWRLAFYKTCGITIARAMVKPLIVLTLAVTCGILGRDTPFFNALFHGLCWSALLLYLGEILHYILLGQGLSLLLPHWSPAAWQRAAWHFGWVKHGIAILTFICATLQFQESALLRNSLGRCCFIAILATITIWLLLIIKNRWQTPHKGWKKILHFLAVIIVTIIPPALAIAAARGYYLSAIKLAEKALLQFFVILGLIFLTRIITGITRQKTANSDLLKDKLPMLNRLVQAFCILLIFLSFLLIWNDMLPALALVNSITLWSIKVGENLQPVSLGDALLALIIIIFTIMLTRNLPTILTLSHFERLPWDSGVRNALSSTIRYTIILVGGGGALGVLGLSWSDIQWLVAAVSVGLGFGLQEIFANFISGIIILFERPVRPGDTVTIGDVSGEVTKINIRATTIKDWDNREMIVPNKEFITGRILNWTGTDKIQRAVISIGVAYGSDTALVQNLLLKAAADSQYVLKAPAPSVVFDDFGDSALLFNLRVYVDIDNLTTAKHTLRLAINEAFNSAGIDIPFPQCTVHMGN